MEFDQMFETLAALPVFYLGLFIAVPLLWLGGHVLAGRYVRAALTGGESMVLAVIGIGILAIPATAFTAARFPLQARTHSVNGKEAVLTRTGTRTVS